MEASLLTKKSIYSPPTINMHSDAATSEQLNYLDHVGGSHSSIHLRTSAEPLTPLKPLITLKLLSVISVLSVSVIPHLVHPRKAVDLPERMPPQRIGHLGGIGRCPILQTLLEQQFSPVVPLLSVVE